MTYRVDCSRLGKPLGVSGENGNFDVEAMEPIRSGVRLIGDEASNGKFDVEAMEPIRSGVKLIGDEASNSKPSEGMDEFSPKSTAGWNVTAPEG